MKPVETSYESPAPEQEPANLVQIESILADHENYRKECLNLIASENITSPAVSRLQANELSHRYGDYSGIDQQARKYQGNRHIVRLERVVTDLVMRLFDARYADLRPLSGHIAGEAVLLALCRPGDTVLELDGSSGGHRLAEKLKRAPLIDLKVEPLPFDGENFNIDVDRCRELIPRLKPRVVILGSSTFLFPHPVAQIREIVDRVPGTFLLYDASHVLGLIAGGRFQAPLKEGAHLVSASTHKTFGGPQGGLVLTNDQSLAERVGEAIYPALVTNHHLHRLPALGAACLEWLQYGPEHAGAVIANAQALAAALAARYVDVVRTARAYTESHTVLAATRAHGQAADLAQRLEEAGIITGACLLPERWGRSGLRFGVQELTRRGMTPADAEPIAGWIVDVLFGRQAPGEYREEVRRMALRLDRCLFGLE